MRLSFRTVIISADEVAAFNSEWPCGNLGEREHFFEFADNGDLIDTSVTHNEDGAAAAAMMQDCRDLVFEGTAASWMRDG